MKISKNLPIYTLSASLVFFGASSTAQAATQYLTLKQYKIDLAASAKLNQSNMKAIAKNVGEAFTATNLVRSELYGFIDCYNVHAQVC